MTRRSTPTRPRPPRRILALHDKAPPKSSPGPCRAVFRYWILAGRSRLAPMAHATICCCDCRVHSGRAHFRGAASDKSISGTAMIAVYALTFFCGLASFASAFNECVERGQEVRILLSEYHHSHSEYPETLNRLRSPIPCSRFTRSTLLTYERTTNGYTLSFHDWLVEHNASEDRSFLAHK